MIGPVQSHFYEGSPVCKRSLRWKGFVEKVGFEPGVKEWRNDGWWVVAMIEISWQMTEKVSRDITGEGSTEKQNIVSQEFHRFSKCDEENNAEPPSPSKRNLQSQQEVKVIWQKAPHGGPIPRLGVTPGGRKLYHWIPGVGFPISVP